MKVKDFKKQALYLIDQIRSNGLNLDGFIESFLDLYRFKTGSKIQWEGDVEKLLKDVHMTRYSTFIRMLRWEVDRYSMQ